MAQLEVIGRQAVDWRSLESSEPAAPVRCFVSDVQSVVSSG